MFVVKWQPTRKVNFKLMLGWKLRILLSADQFDEVNQQVIVTRDRSWHERFKIKSKEMADYKRWSGPSIEELSEAFELICSKLKAI